MTKENMSSYELAKQAAQAERPTWEIYSLDSLAIPSGVDYAETSKAWAVILHKECKEYDEVEATLQDWPRPAEWTAQFYAMFVVIVGPENWTYVIPASRQENKPGGLGFAVEFPPRLPHC